MTGPGRSASGSTPGRCSGRCSRRSPRRGSSGRCWRLWSTYRACCPRRSSAARWGWATDCSTVRASRAVIISDHLDLGGHDVGELGDREAQYGHGPPTITVMMAITMATMGLFMKNLDIVSLPLSYPHILSHPCEALPKPVRPLPRLRGGERLPCGGASFSTT